ncbi:glycoside hydrolase superfamily [Crucibulum laeve]|uniref:Beta-xylanase n=1 Tax=Crucibulum laeve TaxID=68775 RepID=A0A5C3LV53_9AGAR|nr:glycoside hydrolase superfamily [Crucibulum laeve]
MPYNPEIKSTNILEPPSSIKTLEVMLKLIVSLATLLATLPFATATAGVYASGPWGQCGGKIWFGPKTCAVGYHCKEWNPWYYQCVPVAHPTSTHQSSTSTRTSSRSSTTPSPTSTGLALSAKAAGKLYFGSALDNPGLTDEPYLAILSDKNQFTQLTPANGMKWESTEPSRGVYTWTQGDAVLAVAKKNGQLLRGHTCAWHSQLPSWVTAGNFDNATLTSIMVDHCKTVVGHYKGQIYSWDVVNEAFNEDGTFRETVFYNTIGPSYISKVLHAAREADHHAKLYINDYNIDGTGAKSTGMVNLIKSLKAERAPIDGVGIQGHLIVGQVPTTIQANIEQFAALGVEVAITELDIRMELPVTPEKLAQQKEDYKNVIKACANVPACVGVTIWDYTDKYSWVPSVFDGEGAPLPWDENLVKKPAYDGIVEGFAA